MDIVVIKHTSDYRGDHSADINKAYVFPETATLKEVLGAIETDEREASGLEKCWFEIPIQK